MTTTAVPFYTKEDQKSPSSQPRKPGEVKWRADKDRPAFMTR